MLLAGEEVAAQVLTAPELEARRWDGYRGMVAPQLRGDGSWPKASLQAGFEVRIQGAVDAMLTRVPFWFMVHPYAQLLVMNSPSNTILKHLCAAL